MEVKTHHRHMVKDVLVIEFYIQLDQSLEMVEHPRSSKRVQIYSGSDDIQQMCTRQVKNSPLVQDVKSFSDIKLKKGLKSNTFKLQKLLFPFGKRKNFDQISEGLVGVQNVPTSAKWAWNSRETFDQIFLNILSHISSCIKLKFSF